MPNSRDALKKLMEEFKIRAAIQTKRQAEDKGKYLHELTKHEPINEADIARMRREMQFDKFKKGSADPRQFYHATTRQKADFTAKHALDESGMPEGGIRQFDPGWRGATFVTPDAKLANTMFAHELTPSEGGHIYPVHVQVKKPFDFANKAHVDDLMRHDDVLDYAEALGLTPDRFREMVEAGDWSKLEHPPVLDALQDLGHDSMYVNEMGVKNLGIFDPAGKIKSSIGNRGTYDTTEYDITKKDGGEVHMQDGGAAFGHFPHMNRHRAYQDRNAAKDAPVALMRGTLAGIGGSPGDMESMVRMLPGFDEQTILPTSEDVEKLIPFKSASESPVGQVFTGAGQLVGGGYNGPGSSFHALGKIRDAMRSLGPALNGLNPEQKARVIKNHLDYTEMSPRPQYQAGGGVKKQAVDLARRGFMGLRGAAPVEHLPAVVQPTTKSVLDAPISRRSVLQSGVGQLARGALPMGEMLPSAAKAVEAVAPEMTSDAIPGLVMAAIKQGMTENEAVDFVQRALKNAKPTKAFDAGNPDQIAIMYNNLDDPLYTVNDRFEFFGPMRPTDVVNSVLHSNLESGSSPMALRGPLRQIKSIDPERYQQMIESAKDYSMGTYEQALENGMITPENLAKFKRGTHIRPQYRPDYLQDD